MLLVEYPGYGRSAGAPTEASIQETLVEAYDRLCQLPEVDPSAILAYGQSLGGGAVCALARKRRLRALILQSTFTSLRPFATRRGLPPFLLRDTFDSLASVRAYDGPVLVLHGRSDEMIPMGQGVLLSRGSARGVFREYDCGHWCWDPERLPFWSDVAEFLEGAGVLRNRAASPYAPSDTP